MDKKYIIIGFIVFMALTFVVPFVIDGVIIFNAFNLVKQDMNIKGLTSDEMVTDSTSQNIVNNVNDNINNSNFNSKTLLIVCGILLVILLIVWFITTYNKFIKLSKRLQQSESGIDIYLKQRFDLIPSLLEITKGYAKYEKDVLREVTNLRETYMNNGNKDLSVSAKLNEQFNKIIAKVEAYPELKANEGFLKLQEQLAKMESQLQAARRIYNLDVTEYNIKVHSIPSNIIARLFSFKEKPLFEMNENEKENIVVEV